MELAYKKQNVFLYASLMNTAINITENPERYEEKLQEFYKTDIDEGQKAENFLNLIMENPEDRKIYMERWESVKDAKEFSKNDTKGFAKDRFTREQFKNIAERTPSDLVKQAYAYVKEIRDKEKGDIAYGK